MINKIVVTGYFTELLQIQNLGGCMLVFSHICIREYGQGRKRKCSPITQEGGKRWKAQKPERFLRCVCVSFEILKTNFKDKSTSVEKST